MPTDGLSSLNDLNQLVDLLISSPELEVLVLGFCFPDLLFQVSQAQLEPIDLPRLSHLHLGGSITCVTNLLKMLKLPSSATLCLQCISSIYAHTDHLILPLISAHFHNSEFKSFRVITNLLLIQVAASIVPPKSTTSHSIFLEDDMDSEPVTELQFSLDLERASKYDDLYPHAEMLGRICSILPISNVEVLSHIRPQHNTFFQRCKKITTIQVHGWGTDDFLRSLAPQELENTPSDLEPRKGKGKGKYDNSDTHPQRRVANDAAGGSSATTTDIPYPKLTSLLLENLNFTDTASDSGDVLENVLQWRKTNTLPLSKLTISTCKITTEWADCLKKHVKEFEWDGHEGACDPWAGARDDSNSGYSVDDDVPFPSSREDSISPDWEGNEDYPRVFW